ncbi:hypothetical protein HPB52_010135 [Rhipicephalus sanguineus]|uniref:DDE Tnp4 domain-containing protein n=1 Tax=Rhipicephalus sanguineus TaxID=34632 RepID=A0A9D4SQK4_RHISA|nr:hypothetical protein HPB52_010135 [Rhipicephalus sanguineus]
MRKFYEIGGFPGVAGCIDCTHIRIKSPGGPNAEVYRNRKGYFSINVQAITGPQLQFLDVVIGWPGSVHDSRIFDDSRARVLFETERLPGVLLGDAGYACTSFLMTPFSKPGPSNSPEARYQAAHKRTRNTVERAFGIWKRRFPCLHMELQNRLDNTLLIITACAALHNVACMRNEPCPPIISFPATQRPQQPQRHLPLLTPVDTLSGSRARARLTASKTIRASDSGASIRSTADMREPDRLARLVTDAAGGTIGSSSSSYGSAVTPPEAAGSTETVGEAGLAEDANEGTDDKGLSRRKRTLRDPALRARIEGTTREKGLDPCRDTPLRSTTQEPADTTERVKQRLCGARLAAKPPLERAPTNSKPISAFQETSWQIHCQLTECNMQLCPTCHMFPDATSNPIGKPTDFSRRNTETPNAIATTAVNVSAVTVVEPSAYNNPAKKAGVQHAALSIRHDFSKPPLAITPRNCKLISALQEASEDTVISIFRAAEIYGLFPRRTKNLCH